MYNKLCETITNEMNHSIPRYNASQWTIKPYKIAKPYWNEALTYKWNHMRLAENDFLKFNDNRQLKTVKLSNI
jgi:hypothetical protein